MGQTFDFRQQHRELGFGDRRRPVGRTMHDRDRLAPITLAREKPIAQSVADGGFPPSLAFEPSGDRRLCLIGGEAIQEIRIDCDAVDGENPVRIDDAVRNGPHDLPAR